MGVRKEMVMKMHRRRPLLDRFMVPICIIPTVALIVFLAAYPLAWSVYVVVRTWNPTSATLAAREGYFVGLSNFGYIVTDALFSKSFQNSLYFTIVVVAIEFWLGMLAALLLFEEVRLGRIWRTMCIMPMIVTPVVVGVVWRGLWSSQFGFMNFIATATGLFPDVWLARVEWAMNALILADVWEWYPFFFLIFLSGLYALPREPFEAAQIDGASSLSAFRYLTLPMLAPLIVLAIILRAVDAFRTFDLIYVGTAGGPGTVTMTLSMYSFQYSFMFWREGIALASAFLMMFATVVFTYPLVKLLRFE